MPQVESQESFPEFVEAYDEHIYSSQCKGSPDYCLRHFAEKGDLRNARKAIEKGATDLDRGLQHAALGGHWKLIDFLLEKEATDFPLSLR